MELVDGFIADTAVECIHGMMVYSCDWCLGKLRAAPYRQALRVIAPGFVPEVETRRDCELCPSRQPVKGNRVFVRIPRPPMNAWGKGVPSYAPSYQGPVVVAPKIYRGSHRTKNGKWSCDRCDPEGRPAVRETPKNRSVLSAQRIFGL